MTVKAGMCFGIVVGRVNGGGGRGTTTLRTVRMCGVRGCVHEDCFTVLIISVFI